MGSRAAVVTLYRKGQKTMKGEKGHLLKRPYDKRVFSKKWGAEGEGRRKITSFEKK